VKVRRGLFWQVYPTLLGSLLILALLAALTWWLLGGPMSPPPHPASALHHPRAAAHLHMLGMLLLLAAVVGLAAYPVIARLTRRLERLRSAVEAWGGGDLKRRAFAEGGDEIAAVATAFNAAADRTDALLAAHKSLLAHASHELRSPLARLAVAAEMVAADAAPDQAAAVRREIAELDALVDEILLASRLDHAEDIGPLDWVDCLALAAEEAARAGVELLPVASAPLEVMGSPRLLRRLVRNLLDNAREHGAAPITIQLEESGPMLRIAVRDRGPGIPADLVERVFEPFFRPAASTEASGNWGLGLSLVRQIALRHGGRVACMRDGDLTVFEVRLPRAAP
jgi:signal transduction histidine kinase